MLNEKIKKSAVISLLIAIALGVCYGAMFGGGMGMIAFAIAYSALSTKKEEKINDNDLI